MPYTAQEYARAFMMHRAALLDVLEKIPNDKGNFRAWEGGRTFIELLDHLSGTTAYLMANATGQAATKPEPSVSLEAAKTRLRENTETTKKFLSGLSETQLAGQTEFLGMKMSVYALVDFLTDAHEAHHKGQLWMMTRMIGVEPPLFVKFG
jgi:uncharacterized damage-inducible protein DinB